MVHEFRKRASTLRRKVLGVEPMHKDPYATHLPVLATLAKSRPVHRVLELGSGPHSTSLFLDVADFPQLDSLVSYEDDVLWAEEVRRRVGTDPRLTLIQVPMVRQSVPVSVEDFDFVFVDDSRVRGERTETIRAVASGAPQNTLVIIHDFEHRQYRRAARAFEHCFVFDAFTPQVGVCWNGDGVDRAWLRRARSILRENSHVSPTDRKAWRAILGVL